MKISELEFYKEKEVEERIKESYWNILGDYEKRITLKYFSIIRSLPKNRWNNYSEVKIFQDLKIDVFKLPDFIFTANARVLESMAKDYVHWKTREMIDKLIL